MLRTEDLFDLTHTSAAKYLSGFKYPWQALKGIKEYVISLCNTLDKNEYYRYSENVFIHKSAVVSDSANINGPCIIGAESEIRHCAFIRGSALIEKNCVIGNSVELKNVIVSDCVQIPHFNYAGDSIFGYKSHMGAGAITSNVKSDKTLIIVRNESERIETGLRKFGAMVGDYSEIGCNTVLNPGTVIGRNSTVYPLSSVRGTVPPHSIYKSEGFIVRKY